MEDQNQSEIPPEHRAHTSSTAEKPTTANDEKSNIEDTLININKNMSTMADILQKIYTQRDNTAQPLQGKRPTGNKRPHVGSEVSEHDGESESEASTSQSERKLPRRTTSDDEISLYAGDSEDDLANLQSSAQTSQVANDNGRENNADGISQILDDLAKSFGDDHDDKSPEIQPKLAEIVTKR